MLAARGGRWAGMAKNGRSRGSVIGITGEGACPGVVIWGYGRRRRRECDFASCMGVCWVAAARPGDKKLEMKRPFLLFSFTL